MSETLFETKAIKNALTSNAKADALAPIHADAIYPVRVFERLTGLGKASLRKMRREGFIIAALADAVTCEEVIFLIGTTIME
jgi:hypothetical protein